MTIAKNDRLFDEACTLFPGGVNSPVRSFGGVGGKPRLIRAAHGAFVQDVEGREYVDFVGSWGPALLGHAHPTVLRAVHDAVDRGLSFGASTPNEVVLGALMRDRVPALERLRLVSTGTEATMTAVRLARAVTGRPRIVKFSGCYHGHGDALLVEAGSGAASLALPGSAGINQEVADNTVVLPYNDLEAVRRLFAENGDQIAALITEAAPANMGVVPPEPGFNKAVQHITAEHGALLIVDEVLTGFRTSRSGYWGLENGDQLVHGQWDWAPDLFTFGKVIGGGLPVAALGGRAEIMDHLAPVGPVYQAGTLSGNPVALAAGVATLQAATSEVYERINRYAQQLTEELAAAFTRAGVAHVIQRAGNLFSVVFGPSEAKNFDEVKAQETYRYPPFFHSMLRDGVYLPPSLFEAWFVSAAHDDETLEKVVGALPAAARAAAQATPKH